MYSNSNSSGGWAPTGQDGSSSKSNSSSNTVQDVWRSRKMANSSSAAAAIAAAAGGGGAAVAGRTTLVAADGRDRLYWPEGPAAPPPLPQAAGRWRNPLLENLPADALLLRWQDPLQLLQQPGDTDSSSSATEDAAAAATPAAAGGGAFVGQLLGACSEEEMLDKQQVSTANDFERLDVDVPGDPEARIVNPLLAVASFRRSDAGKPFHPSSTRPAVWCRRTVHLLLTYTLDADLTNPVSSSSIKKTPPGNAGAGGGGGEATDGGGGAAAAGEEESGEPESAVQVRPKPYLYSREGRGYRFLDVYNFFRDRLRACWQHLTVQHVEKHRAYIEVLEISCRFLIFAEEQLAASPAFDAVSNQSLLTTCLDKLMQGYEAVRGFYARRDVALLVKQLQQQRRRRAAAAAAEARGCQSVQQQQQEKRQLLQDQQALLLLLQQQQVGDEEKQREEEQEEEEDMRGGTGSWSHRLLSPALVAVERSRGEGQQQQVVLVMDKEEEEKKKQQQQQEGVEMEEQQQEDAAGGICEWTLLEMLAWRSAYEGEFWAYRIMCLMSSSSSEQALVGLLQRLPADLQQHPAIQLALRAFEAFRSCNMRRYILCMRSADYVAAALLNKYANYARARVLHMLLGSRLVLDQRNPMPLHRLRTLLGFDGEADIALYSFLEAYGIRVGAPQEGRQGMTFCFFSTAKKALLQDLNSFKRVRATSYPSRFLRLPPGLSRQQLLDPDYPTDAAAAVPQERVAGPSATFLTTPAGAAAAAALPCEAPSAAVAAAAVGPAGARRLLPFSATAAAAAPQSPPGAAAALHASDAAAAATEEAAAGGVSGEIGEESLSQRPSAASLALKHRLQAAWSRARQQQQHAPHTAAAAAAKGGRGRPSEKIGDRWKGDAMPVAAAAVDTMTLLEDAAAAAGREEPHGEPLQIAAARSEGEELVQKKAGVKKQQQQYHPLPPAGGVSSAGFPSQADASAAPASSVAAAAAADTFFVVAGTELASKQQQLLQAGAGQQQQLTAQQQQQWQRHAGEGAAGEDMSAAASMRASDYAEATDAVLLLKDQQQQISPHAPAAAGSAAAAAPTVAAAAVAPGAAAVGVRTAAGLLSPAAASSSFPLRRRASAAATAPAAAVAATTPAAAARIRGAAPSQSEASAASQKPLLLPPVAAADDVSLGMKQPRQQQTTFPPAAPAAAPAAASAAAAGGGGGGGKDGGGEDAAAADSAALLVRPRRRRSDFRLSATAAERRTAAAAAAGTHAAAADAAAAARPSFPTEASSEDEVEGKETEEREGTETTTREQQLLLAKQQQQDGGDFWQHLIGLSNWRYSRVRQLAIKEILLSPAAPGKEKQPGAAAAVPALPAAAAALPLHKGKPGARRGEPLGPAQHEQQLQLQQMQQQQLLHTNGQQEEERSIEMFPWCFYPQPQRKRLALQQQQQAWLSPLSAAEASLLSAATAARAASPAAAGLPGAAGPQQSVDVFSLRCFPHTLLLLLSAAACGSSEENELLPDLVAAVMARHQQQRMPQQLQQQAHQQRQQEQEQPLPDRRQQQEEERLWGEDHLLTSSCSSSHRGMKQKHLLSGGPGFEPQAVGPLLQHAGTLQRQKREEALGIFCKFLFLGGGGGGAAAAAAAAPGGGERQLPPAAAACGGRLSRGNDSRCRSCSSSGSSSDNNSSCCSSSGSWTASCGALSSSSRPHLLLVQQAEDTEKEISKLLFACLRECVGAGKKSSAMKSGRRHSMGRMRRARGSCSSSSHLGDQGMPLDWKQTHAEDLLLPQGDDAASWGRSGSSSTVEAAETQEPPVAVEELQQVVERQRVVLHALSAEAGRLSSRWWQSPHMQRSSCSRAAGGRSRLLLWQGKQIAAPYCHQESDCSGGPSELLPRQQQHGDEQSTRSSTRRGDLVPLYCCLHALPEDTLWEVQQNEDGLRQHPQQQEQKQQQEQQQQQEQEQQQEQQQQQSQTAEVLLAGKNRNSMEVEKSLGHTAERPSCKRPWSCSGGSSSSCADTMPGTTVSATTSSNPPRQSSSSRAACMPPEWNQTSGSSTRWWWTAGIDCESRSRREQQDCWGKCRRRDGKGEKGIICRRRDSSLNDATNKSYGEQQTKHGFNEAEGEDAALLVEEVFDAATGVFMAFPSLVAVSTASSECRCSFGARMQRPPLRAEEAAAGMAATARAAATARQSAGGEASADVWRDAAAGRGREVPEGPAAVAQGRGRGGGGAAEDRAAAAAIWWESLDTKKDIEKHHHWWVCQAKRVLLLLLQLQARRPSGCTPVPQQPEEQQLRRKQQQKQPTERAREQQNQLQQQCEGDAGQRQKDDVDHMQQQQQRGSANQRPSQQQTEEKAWVRLQPNGPQVRILFALLVPLHALELLQLRGGEWSAIGENSRAVHSWAHAAAATAAAAQDAPRRRRESLHSGSRVGKRGEQQQDKGGFTLPLLHHETGEETTTGDLIDIQIQSEAQALVAVALRQRLLHAAAEAALSIFGKESSNSIRSAAVAALTARVRFTCAAYIPVSRSLLSAANTRPSSLDSWQQEQRQDNITFSCVAAETAVAAADVCGGYGLHLEKQAAGASVGEGRQLPLAAVSAVDLRNSRAVLVVPACSWIRRACRSLVRTALVERRLLLLERPQSPLSLVEAVLCQWKLLLQKKLEAAQRSEARATPFENERDQKKKCEGSCAAGNMLLATSLRNEGDAPVAEVLRSLRETPQMAKLLEAAAQGVTQKIAAVHASAWQLPPAEWWPSVSNGDAGDEVTRRFGHRIANKSCHHCFRRSSSNISSSNNSTSGDTCSSSSSSVSDRGVSSRKSGNLHRNERNDTHCKGGDNKCGNERRKKGEPGQSRAAWKQVVVSALQASAEAGSRKTVYDVVTGKPLLQAELESLLSALDRLKYRPVNDPWRQCLPLSEPDICLRMFYSKKFALHTAQTSKKSLLLLERVTHGAGRTVQDTQKRGRRKELMTGLRIVDDVGEQRRGDITAMPSSVVSVDALLLSTVAGECELLVKAAASMLHAAFCGRDMLHTKGDSRQGGAAAASYMQSPFICLPTPAWQLLHPIAVRPWERQSTPVDVLRPRAVVQKQSSGSQRGQHGRAQQRETHSNPQYAQRVRQDEHEPSELLKQRFLHYHQESRRPARAYGQEGRSSVRNARVTQDEGPGGEPGNIMKHGQRTGDNHMCVTVDGQQEQCNSREVAAHLRRTHPPASSAECLHQAPEEQEQDHCNGSYPLLRETQDTALTLQVLASAKQCRQRAASERDAIEALLSAIRQRSSLPLDKVYGPKR